MHTPESWNKFLAMMQDGIQHRERTGTSKMVHRFDIFEMPKELQKNLTSNNSLMHFTSVLAAIQACSFGCLKPIEPNHLAVPGSRPPPKNLLYPW